MDLSERRILVVEDEPLVGLDLAATIGAAGGTTVGPFSTIEQALTALPLHPVDAAIVDLDLGGEPSTHILQALDREDIPFVICSGYQEISLPARYEARPFVAKPFLRPELFAALALILQRRGTAALKHVLRRAIAAAGADKGNIQVLENDTLRIAAHQGFDRPFLEFFDSVEAAECACGHALKSAQRVIVEDVATSGVFADAPARRAVLGAGVRSVCSTPVVVMGKMRGMLSVHRLAPWHPTADELGQLDRFTGVAGAIIASAGS